MTHDQFRDAVDIVGYFVLLHFTAPDFICLGDMQKSSQMEFNQVRYTSCETKISVSSIHLLAPPPPQSTSRDSR